MYVCFYCSFFYLNTSEMLSLEDRIENQDESGINKLTKELILYDKSPFSR